ncbi:MAG: glycosyltransferase family 2 protein [Methylococcaceae bacterium]|nr:glycosyltransferase family 2 protein [Methylococcaceae bacterium]MCI0668206.1 glycosyltransferase family 2 protein [Methylococcaceae bacterium]
MNLISVIVTTYNRPDALRACLDALSAQTDPDFEILIADDGSGESTRETILLYNTENTPAKAVNHVYHVDRGFRAATIRNKAVARSRGDYIVFMDGDCVVFPDFIAMHRKLAEPGYFVPGNRILLSREYTGEVLNKGIRLYRKSFFFFLRLFLTRKINRCTSLVRLPLGFMRRLHKTQWQKAKTCNLGMWRDDITRVNGFDETYQGWGYEDSDLVIRLIHAGVHRKTGRHAVPVLHLWHPENDRSQEPFNLQRFLVRLEDQSVIFAEKGFDRHTRM